MKHGISFLSNFCLWSAILTLLLLVNERARAVSEMTLHNFNPQQSGYLPDGGVVADAEGNLYGVTVGGGSVGAGTVFEFSPNQKGGWEQKILYNFQAGNDGGDPEGGVIFDALGNLYGMTSYGGVGGHGTVFELEHNPDGSWSEKVLSDIGDGIGGYVSGLVFDKAGNLYGATGSGGPHGGGVVFELSPAPSGKWKQTVLHSFYDRGNITGGTEPWGPLVVDAVGNIYGSTFEGGINCFYGGCGLVFELSPTVGGQWEEKVLYSFTGGSDGEFPDGGLVADSAGNLYGTASRGGSANPECYCGTVFKLTRGANGQWTESTIYSFQNGSDGNFPVESLSFDQAGNLYGVTAYGGGVGFCDNGGCGVVFELTPTGSGEWSESVLYRFNNATVGYEQSSSIFINADDQLFGELWEGANAGQNGVLYGLTQHDGTWNFNAVSAFADSDGSFSNTALIADAKGNLFGTTAFGGSSGLGAVFEMNSSSGGGWNERLIYSFSSGGHPSDGSFSVTAGPSALIADSTGNLYGEAEGGGPKNAGIVYELSPAANGAWAERTLFSFPGGSDGEAPSGGLLMDKSGNLYGTTQYGGQGVVHGIAPSGYGIVFELSPEPDGKWSEKALYQFGGYPTDGAQPESDLIFDGVGNLYGTTRNGGGGSCAGQYGPVIGCGTVFELSSVNGVWSETVLHRFLGGTADGQWPLAGLVLDPSGNLFGTTVQGGSNYISGDAAGTVFELSPIGVGTWQETIIVNFPGSTDQASPYGNLILDASGNLYSTTANFSGGAVFELSPTSGGGWNYTDVYSLNDAPYEGAEAGVIFGPKGSLYGTSCFGGANNAGLVFAVSP